MLILAGGLLLTTAAGLLSFRAFRAGVWPARDGSGYAGSSSCRACHESFYRKWATSHHGTAIRPVSREWMREAAFTGEGQPLVIRGSRFSVDPAKRRMREVTADGKTRTYRMVHAMGGKNVYYFLTPLAKGRLQVLPLAYDVAARKWYDTTASMVRHFLQEGDSPLDWRDPLLTFNTACFGCHVSQIAKHYDPETDSYRTVWREPGISCETCHGPSGRHNRVCRDLPPGVAPTNLFLTRWGDFTPEQASSACAPCHAKMRPLTAAFVPGEEYFDHYDLACLEDPDFSADGRDLGENYTYTRWLMNPCLRSGKLDCVRCHTSSGRYRFAPAMTNAVNAACTDCHAEKRGNRIAAHSRHAVDGPAGRCTACHMPMTSFAGMRRSDHSHRPPCPEAAQRFGGASACVLCHSGRTEAWAAEALDRWHPQRAWRGRILREGGLVDAARRGAWDALEGMLAYLREEEAEPVVCASLLRLLRGCPDREKVWPEARRSLRHASPLVRGTAAALLADNLGEAESAAGLFRALGDPVRLVRLQAVQALAAYPRQAMDAVPAKRLRRAEAELDEMFGARPDDWATRYNLANYRLARGDAAAAMSAYREAMRLRPDAVMPHVNAAVLASRQGDLPAAVRYLREALRSAPEHGAVNLNLGLALAEQGAIREAVHHLRTAMKDAACRAQAAYNCAVLVGGSDPREAAALCRMAADADPGNPRYAEGWAYYARAAGLPVGPNPGTDPVTRRE